MAKAYEEGGVESYELLATLDLRTSPICQHMDGKKFLLKDKKTGINYPPLHPHCRTVAMPCYDDDIERRLDERAGRAGRNPETGKTENVGNLKYKEWYKKYVKDENFERTKSSNKNKSNSVNWSFIKFTNFKENINQITKDSELNNLMYKKTVDILEHRQNTDFEDLIVIDRTTKKVVGIQRHSKFKLEVTPNKSIIQARKNYKNKIIIHNHPSNLPPSDSDFASNFRNRNELGVVVCHSGEVYTYRSIKKFEPKLFDLSVRKFVKLGYNEIKTYTSVMNDFAKKGWLEWKKISIKD